MTTDTATALGVEFDKMVMDEVFRVRTEPYTEEELALAMAWADCIKRLPDKD
jgi:hypothetical protein